MKPVLVFLLGLLLLVIREVLLADATYGNGGIARYADAFFVGGGGLVVLSVGLAIRGIALEAGSDGEYGDRDQ